MKSNIISLVFYGLLYLTMVQGYLSSPETDSRVKVEVNFSPKIKSSFQTLAKPFRKIHDKFYYIEKNRNAEVNWYGALHKCRELDANLVNFKNKKTLNAILSQLEKRKCYWIDLTDLGERHKFRSITTGDDESFMKWGPDEPNNMGGNEQCVQLRVNYNDNKFIMNDNKCNRVCSFICETKAPIQTDIVVWGDL